MAFFEFPHTRTYDSDLGWIIRNIGEVVNLVEQLEIWKTEHEADYEELKALYDAVMAGNFPPSITEAFNRWMSIHALDLVGELVKNVFFGLTDAGYFIAYIPESWDDITFNTTVYDIIVDTMPEYGHLVLSY